MAYDYSTEKENGWDMLDLTLEDGKEIRGEFFDGTALENVPQDKYDYFLRHADDDWSQPIGVKKNKGLTVNFLGSIVLDEPLDFGDKDELVVTDWGLVCD